MHTGSICRAPGPGSGVGGWADGRGPSAPRGPFSSRLAVALAPGYRACPQTSGVPAKHPRLSDYFDSTMEGSNLLLPLSFL